MSDVEFELLLLKARVADVEFELLLLKARVAVERMTPDEHTHMRHEQRVSFVTGNLRMSGGDEGTEARVREACGPCPCARCRA